MEFKSLLQELKSLEQKEETLLRCLLAKERLSAADLDELLRLLYERRKLFAQLRNVDAPNSPETLGMVREVMAEEEKLKELFLSLKEKICNLKKDLQGRRKAISNYGRI